MSTARNADDLPPDARVFFSIVSKQDAKLAKLDNMDEDDLDKIREKRKAQLIAAQKIKQVSAAFPFVLPSSSSSFYFFAFTSYVYDSEPGTRVSAVCTYVLDDTDLVNWEF